MDDGVAVTRDDINKNDKKKNIILASSGRRKFDSSIDFNNKNNIYPIKVSENCHHYQKI